MKGERYYVGTDTLYQLVTSVDAWVTNPDIANDYKMALMELCDRIKSERTSPELAVHDSRIAALESQLAERDAEIERLRNACIQQNAEICQTLGKALGYPWYKDDQKNFPGATEENGVFVGEHVAETLAMEAAKALAAKDAMLAAVETVTHRAVDTLRFCFGNIKVTICGPMDDCPWEAMRSTLHPRVTRDGGLDAPTFAELCQKIAAGWLSQEAKGGTK